MSNFTIRVDKKLPEGTYKLTLVAEGITPWESDLVSHDADGKAYVVVNSTEGNLKDSIVAAKKDYTKLKNLKVTGCINVRDFDFMRDDCAAIDQPEGGQGETDRTDRRVDFENERCHSR